MAELAHGEYKYEVDNNGYIITSFESCDSGDLKFYIKKLPSELDTTTNLYFPLIPDDEDLITALEWYILKRLLERGHKVNNYSLSVNNEHLNPALAWDIWRKKAISSISSIDPDEREQISKVTRTFIQNANYYDTDALNIETTN